MQNSDQIKEAPRLSAHSRQIFKNFRDATVALLECDDKPAGVRDAVSGMLDYFGDFHVAGHTTDARRARYVLSCVFDLGEEEETPAARCGRALEELTQSEITLDVAEAFDVIKKYERVLPESITAPLDEAIGEFNEAEDIEAHEEAARAARELAGAFAAIEQWRDYMPASIYNPIQEALMEWIIGDGDAKFLHNPDSLRAGLPGIFRGIFKLEEEAA